MLPSDYGLSAYDPEAYVAIAVDDLLRNTDVIRNTSKEYLGMLSLYALRRSIRLFSEKDESICRAFKLADENFDPFNMSENLVRCLTDLIEK
ncbi:hypothetical protein [Oribacterium sp. P9]|uniref:hypothetical protein n=1 Tax=Oribacterium sp. P9 TaxID=3378068 RepID=UPI003967BD82